MYTSNKEALILKYIYNNDSLKQRELADKAGISLGMVNAILKQLIEKGLLMSNHLNSRNISYVVTPVGIDEINKRSYLNFKQTIADIILYRETIEHVVTKAVNAGYKCIVLVGNSDLDFLIEYACGKAGISFEACMDIDKSPQNKFLIYSEQLEKIIIKKDKRIKI